MTRWASNYLEAVEGHKEPQDVVGSLKDSEDSQIPHHSLYSRVLQREEQKTNVATCVLILQQFQNQTAGRSLCAFFDIKNNFLIWCIFHQHEQGCETYSCTCNMRKGLRKGLYLRPHRYNDYNTGASVIKSHIYRLCERAYYSSHHRPVVFSKRTYLMIKICLKILPMCCTVYFKYCNNVGDKSYCGSLQLFLQTWQPVARFFMQQLHTHKVITVTNTKLRLA